MANAFNRGKYLCLTRDIDATTWGAILLSSSYSFNVDHNTLNEISAQRLNTDQTPLASIGATEDDTNDIAYLDATDPTWTSVASGDNTVGCVIFYDSGGAETADELLCYVSTSSTPTNGGDITINFSATEGFFKLT